MVKVIWIVFHNEQIGKLYRFEHRHLRQNFNPGHGYATPILPCRKTFKTTIGNIKYQRENFALSFAYAVTPHKAHGKTLQEVIIDYGPDEELKIKSYVIPGSFYVALTRVREGKCVYLRSFEDSYIQVNPAIQSKIDAMLKFRQYKFKKTFLNDEIFVNAANELKVGYLNINGLLDSNHIHYLNSDKNLCDLDILVLAETKLTGNEVTDIKKELSNWIVIGGYDSVIF